MSAPTPRRNRRQADALRSGIAVGTVLASLAVGLPAVALLRAADTGPEVIRVPGPTATVVREKVRHVPLPGPTVVKRRKVKVRVPVPGPTRTVYPRADRARPAAASGSPRALGRARAAARGWSAHWPCLDALWSRESGWDPNARNPTSTAYGIAQFLDSTWAGTGIAKTADPGRQITAGLRYIAARYGDPCRAWRHSQAVGWY